MINKRFSLNNDRHQYQQNEQPSLITEILLKMALNTTTLTLIRIVAQ
jgi:hypothetical protein